MADEATRRQQLILDTVTEWPGVETASGRYGEIDFLVGRRSIGHIHGGHQADIRYPRPIRDQLVSEGRTGPHHVHPDSGWTTLYIRNDADAATAVDLLRINYDRVTAKASAVRS